MTSEQLDEIEKLARDPKSAAFHDLMARQTLPLVKALREARAEVERLREAVRQVHVITGRDVNWAAFPGVAAASISNIHEFTKGMVE